jgi:hypothetical protein
MRAPLPGASQETGGRFYERCFGAARSISHSGRGVTVVEERDPLDMPAILCPHSMTGGEWRIAAREADLTS